VVYKTSVAALTAIPVRFHMVVIDRADPRSLAAFWEGFTGYQRRSDHEDWVSIHGPTTRCGLDSSSEGKVVKNRVHIDFAAVDEEARRKRSRGMGATRRWVSEYGGSLRRPRRSEGERVLYRARARLRLRYSVSRSAPRLDLFNPVTDGLTTTK
jgi:hypothetical protein